VRCIPSATQHLGLLTTTSSVLKRMESVKCIFGADWSVYGYDSIGISSPAGSFKVCITATSSNGVANIDHLEVAENANPLQPPTPPSTPESPSLNPSAAPVTRLSDSRTQIARGTFVSSHSYRFYMIPYEMSVTCQINNKIRNYSLRESWPCSTGIGLLSSRVEGEFYCFASASSSVITLVHLN